MEDEYVISGGRVYRSEEAEHEDFAALSHEDRIRILRYLRDEGPDYASSISSALGIEEQRCRYHISCLLDQDFLEVSEAVPVNGSEAKNYSVSKSVHFRGSDPVSPSPPVGKSVYSDLFSECSSVDLVGGSPYPHGPKDVGARDTHLLGRVAKSVSRKAPGVHTNIRLDTHQRTSENMVSIGGPLTNTSAETVLSRAEPSFDGRKGFSYALEASSRYRQKNVGVVVFANEPVQICLAGVGLEGTKACVEFFCSADEHGMLSSSDPAYFVVEGLDSDSDGIVDEFQVLETG
jgi:hypothetical protein